MITLTGGVAAGRRVLDYSKVNIAKSSLEPGGKTPAIVAADADLEQAAHDIVRSKTTNCGRLCTAVKRVCVQRAVQAGTRLECGGVLPRGPGYFYPPTLLTGVAQGAEIVQEEVFGPVLCVLPCDTFDDALAMASDHQLGLAPVFYTENYRQVMQAGNEIEAGELYINRTPAEPQQGYHAGWTGLHWGCSAPGATRCRISGGAAPSGRVTAQCRTATESSGPTRRRPLRRRPAPPRH
jgi:lactaldehyde dehydrogenase/glycolaldehyde dehydrogenase